MLIHFLLITIVVLVFILYPYLYTPSSKNEYEYHLPRKQDIIQEKQQELEKMVLIVVNHIQLHRAFSAIESSSKTASLPFILPSYSLIASETATYIEEPSIIYMVFCDEGGNLYEDNTLRYVMLRAIAQIMTKNEWNAVQEVEDVLINTAIKLDYYDPDLLDETYPCRF